MGIVGIKQHQINNNSRERRKIPSIYFSDYRE